MSERFQQHVLECHRVAAECMQLAGDAPTQAQRSHFLRMARQWIALAERAPGGHSQAGSESNGYAHAAPGGAAR
jgi:hypothetical protein